MPEQGICVLNHSPSCIVGNLGREIFHRGFQEESVRGLGQCRYYEEGHILRNGEMQQGLVEGVLGRACEIWRRDHSDVCYRWSKRV